MRNIFLPCDILLERLDKAQEDSYRMQYLTEVGLHLKDYSRGGVIEPIEVDKELVSSSDILDLLNYDPITKEPRVFPDVDWDNIKDWCQIPF